MAVSPRRGLLRVGLTRGMRPRGIAGLRRRLVVVRLVSVIGVRLVGGVASLVSRVASHGECERLVGIRRGGVPTTRNLWWG